MSLLWGIEESTNAGIKNDAGMLGYWNAGMINNAGMLG